MNRILMSTALALALAPAAWAFDETDRTAVRTLSADFKTAFEARDMATVVGLMPPGITEYISAQTGMDIDKLNDVLIEQSEQVMDFVTIEDFDMDLDKISTGTTDTGRDYALVPTVTSLSVGGQPAVESETRTLFLEDGGDWYLVRIEDARQTFILTEAYPDLRGLGLQ